MTLYSQLAHAIWTELKSHITTADRNEAADSLVNILIDHDIDIKDIKDTFDNDTDVRKVLWAYDDENSQEDMDIQHDLYQEMDDDSDNY